VKYNLSVTFVVSLFSSNRLENKKLRYGEEHSASVVLRWCTVSHLSGENMSMANQPLTYWAPKATESGEITQNEGHYDVLGHTRAPILVPIESPYTTSY